MPAPKRLADRDPGESRGCAGSGQLDFHVHARGEVELHQRVDRLRGGLHDVEQPLVGAHLELLARLLVDVRTAVHGELLDTRRQRDRTRSEEHTSELQSLMRISYAVFCLKKKQK